LTAYTDENVPLPGGLQGAPKSEIAGYDILAKIGSGLHGNVYLARFAGGAKVALKVLKLDSADVHAKERFGREIDALKRLNVQNVARVIDFEFSSDNSNSPANRNVSAFIATEFIDGLTLDKYIEAHGILDKETAIAIFDALYNAILKVHKQGILHRDIKPSNIIIESETLKPYLIDFSIAKDINDSRITKTGFVAGSPAYISPEALRGDEPSESDDFWGLTASFCYALTGKNPFGTKDVDQIIGRIFTLNPDLEGIPQNDARTLRLALFPDSQKRMQFYELLNLLEVPDETEIINRETEVLPVQTDVINPNVYADESPTLVYNNHANDYQNVAQFETSSENINENIDEQSEQQKPETKSRAFAKTAAFIGTFMLAFTFVSFAVNMPGIAFITLTVVYAILNLLGRVSNSTGFVVASVSVFSALLNTALKIVASIGFAFAVSKIVGTINTAQNAANTVADTVNNASSSVQIIPELANINLDATQIFAIPPALRDFFASIALPINETNWIAEIALLVLATGIALIFFTAFGAKFTFRGVQWIAKKSMIARLVIILASVLMLIFDYYTLRAGLQSVYVNWSPL
jgi:serine/threonine protein kinase